MVPWLRGDFPQPDRSHRDVTGSGGCSSPHLVLTGEERGKGGRASQSD